MKAPDQDSLQVQDVPFSLEQTGHKVRILLMNLFWIYSGPNLMIVAYKNCYIAESC